ncbi:MAG: hypothetical protein CVT63_06335 [Candidatus Anoxymicrobium japonicum]|uniref:RNA-binding protein KhpB n=1 Tax=Candidatus Anoxymicrobium japonicum TaxID=2013648 RepID=A0A2N3G552_9ACTN|nr:MAG: hypothetical protein CVT63_06335 [Candidatus Anoxymicrobium japonicum]
MKETSWEYTGSTVEEATHIALEELGLERDDIFVEVLEEPQKGFLGFGGVDARIKVEMIGEWEVTGKKTEPGTAAPRDRESRAASSQGRKSKEEKEEASFQGTDTDKPVAMVEDILEMIGVEASVESREREDALEIDIWGDDVAIIIGRAGATLDALQFLVNISCRRQGDISKRIIVDVERYRKRRKKKLEDLAEQMALDAKTRGESVEMLPMSASERKIVHMALREIPGVWTESIGEETGRRIVINPGNKSST